MDVFWAKICSHQRRVVLRRSSAVGKLGAWLQRSSQDESARRIWKGSLELKTSESS